jgi:uncharacterized protein YlxW (UPF0749 family)
MQGKTKDRNAQLPQGAQVLTELKYLKAQIAKKDLRIKELEEQVKQVATLGAQVRDLENRISALQAGAPEAPGPIFATGALPPPAKP